jgi:ATP-binding cassette, subfamily B, bacterial HlyB/CyaB
MTYTELSIPEFLATVPAFEGLGRSDLDSLAKRMQPLRYRMGQPILRRETLPHQVLIVYKGQARLLGFDPNSQAPFPLKRLEPGAIVGWQGLLRGVACETVTASSDPEVVCLTLPAHEFINLIDQNPAIAAYFQGHAGEVEVAAILSGWMQQQAKVNLDLKTLVPEAHAGAIVTTLTIGSHQSNQLNAQYSWWVSGGQVQGLPVGTLIDPELTPRLEVQGRRSARLLGIPTHLLRPVVIPDSYPGLATADQNGLPQNGNASGLHLNGAGRDDVATPVNAVLAPEIPFGPDQPPDIDEVTKRRLEPQSEVAPNYPQAKGQGALAGALACFEMLAKRFNLPFRRDVIRRVLSDQIARTGVEVVPLGFCGAVSELMGLRAQLVAIPATAIGRIETPALILFQENLAVLYEVNSREVAIGIPEVGQIKRYRLDTFADIWGAQGEILLLQKTADTPQQKFGLAWFLPAVAKHRKILIEVLVASLFVQALGLANPLMIQVIIDKVITQNSIDTLQVLGIFLVVIAIFEGLLTTLRTYLFVETTNRIDLTLGSEIIDHLFRLPLRYFEKRPVGELSSRVNELENIRQFLTGTALTVVLDSIFSVIYIVVMLIYSWLLTLVALASIPLFILLTIIFAPIVRRLLRRKAEHYARTQSYLVEALSGIQTVKAQNIELQARWQWQNRYARYVSSGFKTVLTSTVASSMSDFLNKLSALLVLWVGAYLVLKGDLTLGQLIAFRIIAGYVTGPLLRLAQLWQTFQETALSLERLSDIIDHPQETTDDDRNNILMPTIQGHIRYEEVCFRFGPSGPMQLVNVTHEFPKGKFVGIVGQSGSGKSTLTKLLLRLYEPASGRILIDDYDIGKVELYSLRRQIGVVPQDSILFEGTIQENIALTRPEASTEDIVAAARVAGAHDFIMEMPSGYNSQVGERGSNLSGGQRQRIAIARTVLQKPRLLILDEATSALDYNTERQVCMNIMEAFRGKTVLFITHRLTTIQGADMIVMMDKGGVVETGTHNELMGQRGRYFCLYQQQDSQM